MPDRPASDPWVSPKLHARIDADASTSVHPPELKSELPADVDGGAALKPTELAQTFRHSGWARHRQLIFDALHRTRQSHTRRDAFRTCGAHAFIYRSLEPPYRYRLAGSSCHDKFCVPCARDRSRCMATNVLNHVAGQTARFITLTLKHSAAPLAQQLARLQRCFASLRGTKTWKQHVTGGAAFIEAKWIPHTESWHPHFHVICQGTYFPQDALKAAWWRITGDSHITDVRFVQDDKKIAGYVTKYASKPANASFIGRPDQLDEVIAAFRGRRLCHTFGTWRGLRLTETPGREDWVSLGSLHDVARQAIDGDAESAAAIAGICGDRADDVLAIARTARPPPTTEPPTDRQLFFVWPAIDNRF